MSIAGVTSQGQVTNITGTRRYHRDATGWSTTFTYTGEEADMSSKADSFGLGWDIDLVQDDAGVWNLTAKINIRATNPQDGLNEVPVINWDLSYEKTSKSLLDMDLPGVRILPDYVAKSVRDAIKNGNDNVIVTDLLRYQTAGAVTDAQINAAVTAYHHMQKGFTQFPVFVPVLTKSATVSGNYNIPWSVVNIGAVIYSTSRLIAEEDVSSYLHAVLPDQQFRNSDPGINAQNAIPLQYGWLKEPVLKQGGSNNRALITQRWIYGLFPTTYYGNPI